MKKVPAERLRPIYERHGIEPGEKVEALVGEICLDGSNTIASVLRGFEGVAYSEVLLDVARKLGADVSENQSDSAIEMKMLAEVLSRYLRRASPQEREKIQEQLKKIAGDNTDFLKNAGEISASALGLLFAQLGKKAAARLIEKIILVMVGERVAAQAAKQVAAKAAGLAIPLVNFAMIMLTIIDIAGPAYRKVIPTALEIALLRLDYGDEEVA